MLNIQTYSDNENNCSNCFNSELKLSTTINGVKDYCLYCSVLLLEVDSHNKCNYHNNERIK